MKRFPQRSSLFPAALILALILSQASSAASILGYRGPLIPTEDGRWKEYRTSDQSKLLPVSAEDRACRVSDEFPANLRQLLLEHFRYYSDHSKSQLTSVEIARFAKVTGMATQESSGIAASATDMDLVGSLSSIRIFHAGTKRPGREGLANGYYSSLKDVDQLMALDYGPVLVEVRKNGRAVKVKKKGKWVTKRVEVSRKMKWNSQTNFGLLQMSADRLGREKTGELAREMLANMRELNLSHPDELIDRCGTKVVFKDSEAAIRNAFRKLQACTPGMKNKAEVQCFARWAILCPNYNISLALIEGSGYFASRDEAPLCAKTFRKILKTDAPKAETETKKEWKKEALPPYLVPPSTTLPAFSFPEPKFWNPMKPMGAVFAPDSDDENLYEERIPDDEKNLYEERVPAESEAALD